MTLTYEVSSSRDPSEFGASYWAAIHNIVSEIPCELCREEAERFVTFWHDLKNKELGKEIYNKKNFDIQLNKIISKNSSYKNNLLLLSFLSSFLFVLLLFNKN